MPHLQRISSGRHRIKCEKHQYFAPLPALVAELPLEERTTRAECGHCKPSWPREASLIIAAMSRRMHKTFRAGK